MTPTRRSAPYGREGAKIVGSILTTPLFEHVLRIPDEIHHHVGAVNVVEYQPAKTRLVAFLCPEHN